MGIIIVIFIIFIIFSVITGLIDEETKLINSKNKSHQGDQLSEKIQAIEVSDKEEIKKKLKRHLKLKRTKLTVNSC